MAKLIARVTGGLDRASDAKLFPMVVGQFLDRLDALATDRTPSAKSLSALLAARGLTAEVRAEGRALLDALMAVAPLTTVPDPRSPERQRDAFQAALSFYREWSAISRAVIQDKRALAALGFGKAGRPKGKKNAPKAAAEQPAPPHPQPRVRAALASSIRVVTDSRPTRSTRAPRAIGRKASPSIRPWRSVRGVTPRSRAPRGRQLVDASTRMMISSRKRSSISIAKSAPRQRSCGSRRYRSTTIFPVGR